MINVCIYLIIGLIFWIPIFIRDVRHNQYTYGGNTFLSQKDGTWKQAMAGSIDWSNLIGTFVVDFLLWPLVVTYHLGLWLGTFVGWTWDKFHN